MIKFLEKMKEQFLGLKITIKNDKNIYKTLKINHFPLLTLNLKKIMSPSSTVYYFPACNYFPSSLTAFSLPYLTKSAYLVISAHINPLI